MEYHPTIYRIKKSIPILIILIVLALGFVYREKLFGGLFESKPQNASQNSVVGTTTPNEKRLTADEEKKLQEQVAGIVKTGDPKGCDQIANEMYQNVCKNNIYLNKAGAEKDASYCRQLDGKLVSVQDCESEVLYPEAIEKENISLCDQTSSEDSKLLCRRNYISVVPIKKKDINICDFAEDEKSQNDCRDAYSFLVDFSANPFSFDCQRFNDAGVRSDCLKYQENKKEGQKDLCTEINSPYFSNLCVQK